MTKMMQMQMKTSQRWECPLMTNGTTPPLFLVRLPVNKIYKTIFIFFICRNSFLCIEIKSNLLNFFCIFFCLFDDEISDIENDEDDVEVDGVASSKKKSSSKKQAGEEFVMNQDETLEEFQARVNKEVRAKLAKNKGDMKNGKQRKRTALRIAKKQKSLAKQNIKDLDKRDHEYLHGKEEIVFGDIAKAPPKLSKIKDCNKRSGEKVLGKTVADYADKNYMRGFKGMMLPPGLK